ncbi:MAG: glycosyltransferase family 2 protein [Chitinophagaceae bacterium]
MPLDLTIAIPVKNEEKNLAGCLDAIGNDFASKVVLIDSGSTDGTHAIANRYGVEVINFEWNGEFPKKRNWYLRNHTPATAWILFLDADEYITPAFKKEVQKELANTDKVGYWLNYTIYFMNRKLKGGYPLNKLALFRIGAGEYERIDEKQWSRLDMEIHEHPILTGKTGHIKSKIDHRDFRGIAHYISKHNDYSSWEAGRFIKTYNSADRSEWTWKQKLKYGLMNTPFIGPVYFFSSYFLLGGFRDGARGFAFAIMKMAYFTETYCKIKEQRDAG